YDGVDVRGVFIEAASNHDASFAMGVDTRADEFGTRLQDEVAAHRAPCEVHFIALEPNVIAAGSQPVLLRHSIVGRVAGELRRADVRMRFEYAEWAAARGSMYSRCHDEAPEDDCAKLERLDGSSLMAKLRTHVTSC